MVVPKMVKNGNNPLLRIHNHLGLYSESMRSKMTQPLNHELKCGHRDLNPNGFKSQPKIELWWSRPEPKPWFAS
jgi:hypothetical protein